MQVYLLEDEDGIIYKKCYRSKRRAYDKRKELEGKGRICYVFSRILI